MPELPDITLYVEALRNRLNNAELVDFRLHNSFFLRSVEPAPDTLTGRKVSAVERLGKRIVIVFGHDLRIVMHLMIAGRLHWHESVPAQGRRNVLADLKFSTGVLRVTEAGTRKRASMYVVGAAALVAHDPGGLEVLQCDYADFCDTLTRGNHTLKRALTDPRLLSGIGNAYSDEILHAAGLSPFTLTQRLDDASMKRLFNATRDVLLAWTGRLREQYAGAFPTRVTAFREGMAVHGRYGKACPVCGTTVQRIRYASNETNYCPRCQTGGRILADRSLSRLLKKDWPRTADEFEQLPDRDKF